MQLQALIVGNSDGIGLAAIRRLLEAGWNTTGISRSESPITALRLIFSLALII